jgi:hypothetical protein
LTRFARPPPSLLLLVGFEHRGYALAVGGEWWDAGALTCSSWPALLLRVP